MNLRRRTLHHLAAATLGVAALGTALPALAADPRVQFDTSEGSFVLELADSVPHPGDVFQKDGYLFRVQSMRGRRVAMLRVTAPEPPKPEPAEHADDQDQKDKDAKKDSKGLKLRKDKKDKDQSKGDDESKDEERQEQAQERMAEAREETSDGLTPDVD